jgi:hypothetical protein
VEIDPNALVNRAELTAVVESIRREMSGFAQGQTEMTTKLDTLLANKTDDARQMGALQEQVRRLGEDVRHQGIEIGSIRAEANRAIEAPKDRLIQVGYDLIKLMLAAGLGYLAHRGLHL